MRSICKLGWGAVAALVLAAPALAHEGHGAGGFAAGFSHPVTGLDHLLAMLAVGALAARRGGHALWLAPLSFVGFMAAGAVAARAGFVAPYAELGILTSVAILIAAIFVARRLPALALGVMCGGFALFHGAAHGLEGAHGAAGQTFLAGALLATAILHGVGAAMAAGVAGLLGRFAIGAR